MNCNVIGLLITFIVGLSFLLGKITLSFSKRKDILNKVSIGISFTVMIGMLIFDLFKEAVELFSFSKYNYLLMSLFIILGFVIFIILDKLVPHHEINDKTSKSNETYEHNNHLFHIGFITSLSLLLHNFIEGMALYSITLTSIKAGIIMGVSIFLHNLFLGIGIMSSFSKSDKSNIKKYGILILLILSSFIGGLTIYLLNIHISNFVLGCLISFTIGMILYIVFMELLVEIINMKEKKYSFIGMFIGLVAFLISQLL